MPSPAEVAFDRPRLLRTARSLRTAADDLESRSEEALAELTESAETETSVNVRGGGPAPLYSELMASMESGAEQARQRVAETASDLRESADALEAAARESAQADAAGVSAVDDTDTELN